MNRRLTLGAALLCLTACVAKPLQIQHLQLSAGDAALPRGMTPVIVLDAVDVPDYLLRDELLRRESPYALSYDGTRRWAEPLDLGVQRVLGRRLRAALDTQELVLFPDAPSRPADWQLRVTVTHFEATGSTVSIAAEGRWKRTTDATIIVESVAFEDSRSISTQDGETIADAMSQLLWRFADALALAITDRSTESGIQPADGQIIEIETTHQ